MQVDLPRTLLVRPLTSVIFQYGLTATLAAGRGSDFDSLLRRCTRETGSESEIFRLPTSTTVSTLGCIGRA